jgi:hypothetical protein
LIPSALEQIAPDAVWIAVIAGFTTFALERMRRPSATLAMHQPRPSASA